MDRALRNHKYLTRGEPAGHPAPLKWTGVWAFSSVRILPLSCSASPPFPETPLAEDRIRRYLGKRQSVKAVADPHGLSLP
jgi:hypothetical protein